MRADDLEASSRLVCAANSESDERRLVPSVKIFTTCEHAPAAGPSFVLRELREAVGQKPFARHLAQMEGRRSTMQDKRALDSMMPSF